MKHRTMIASAIAIACCMNVAHANDKPVCATGDRVVFVNSKSHIYHYATVTKSGEYACESDAIKQGARASKNEKAF